MWLYHLLKIMFIAIYRVIFRTNVSGTENVPLEGPVILAANNMSYWDPPLVGSFSPRTVNYMAKVELFQVPLLKYVMTTTRCIPVRRGTGDSDAVKAAVKGLKNDACITLFPEGTCSRTGKLLPPQPGVALIAALTKAPVVPIAILGTNRILANGGIFPKLRIRYGEPIYFHGNRRSKDDLVTFSEEIMSHIADMQEAMRQEAR